MPIFAKRVCTALLVAALVAIPSSVLAQESQTGTSVLAEEGQTGASVLAQESQTGGEDPLVTDRPDATESPETVRPGRFQIEGGYTLLGVDELREHSLGEILVRVGVVDRIELRFGLNSYSWLRTPDGTVSGLSDTSFGLKAKLVQGNGSGLASPTLALLVSTTLPTGADEFSSGGAEPDIRLAAAWELSERVGLASNIGWAYANDRDAGERFHELASSVALGYGLSERWGAFIEYFGFYPVDQVRPSENFVDGGLTYLVRPDFQLDGRVGYGLNGADDSFFVGFGTTARW